MATDPEPTLRHHELLWDLAAFTEFEQSDE